MNTTQCGGKRRHRSRKHRGGGYTTDVSQSIAGFATITPNREVTCASYDTRGGNNVTGGRRRKRTRKATTRRRKTAKNSEVARFDKMLARQERLMKQLKGGGGSYGTPVGSDLALNVPRAGYGYAGKGIAGYADPTPIY